MVTQILYIHGGMTFKDRSEIIHWLKSLEISLEGKKKWRDEYLTKSLGDNFQIIKPRMPLSDDAQYEEWKVWFEKHLEILDDKLILIGTSLGGVFLAKYLSENKINKQIISTYLIAPPFDGDLIGEDLVGGFELADDLSLITKQCGKVRLMFSKDDDCVPVSHADKYQAKLPEAKYIIYESKGGHFQIEEFPEIVNMIKEDVK